MGWFSNPDCPICGRETVRTGYSAGYPALRCNHCCREHAKKKKEEDRIKALEKRIKDLEAKQENKS